MSKLKNTKIKVNKDTKYIGNLTLGQITSGIELVREKYYIKNKHD